MTVSLGFFKKIKQWILAEGTDQVLFRPFQTNGNPYKSSVFLVSAHATPLLKVEENSEQVFIDALVNADLLEELYSAQFAKASREVKGSRQFANWMNESYGENIVCTSINTYQINDAKELKVLKKEDLVNYQRGIDIFTEVVDEFQPDVIILQGAAAVEQFKALYAEHLFVYHPEVTKVQDLENTGSFAEMYYKDGKVVKIFATRSMAYFGKDGSAFGAFKGKLQEVLGDS